MTGLSYAYEKMLLMERIAGDPAFSRAMRLKADRAARLLRGVVERVPENG